MDQPSDENRISPDAAARRDAARRRLDELDARHAAKTADREGVAAKVAQLESTVVLLSQAVSDLALTVGRLADERLGDHEPATGSPPADDTTGTTATP